MVEPFLFPVNGNPTSTTQSSQSWENKYSFSTTTTRDKLLFDNDNDNDEIQFVNEIRHDSGRPAHTVDLSKSIFDVKDEFNVYLNGNSRNTHSMAYTAHSNHNKPHTITTDQIGLNNPVAVPSQISQILPKITIADFAKEPVLASHCNGANASNDIFDLLDDAPDWVEDEAVVNHIFHPERLPKTIVPTTPATTIANDVKWEDIFGAMKPLTLAANDPTRLNTSTSTSGFQFPLHKFDATNSNASLLNATEPNTWESNIGPLLPQTNKVNATSIDQQNQPGPSGITQPREVLTHQGESFEYGRMFTPFTVNGMPIMGNLKRRHKATIPIKVVRSTKQYETLVEMGFLKKDIEIALRKCNLDLYETIEYLSEPKRSAKKRKIQQNDLNPFHVESLNPVNEVETEPIKKPPANLYEELLQLEETGGIVKSIESFDCEICMETIDVTEGMILRNCLHRYCKDCLNGTIVHSDDIAIKCPYVNCEEMVQDREIRAVLSQDEYEKYLMKGVRVAQVTISGTVLCNLPDCNGWCICEDVVNEFKCPQCQNINCIPCKAIHPERNCREYQDDLAAGDANGIISGQRRSEQAIQDLINRNEAMKCFSCGILIMKRDGCDYIQCVMCKAGICWATRGPRYGPGGVGDFSGGCHCSTQKKCHKDCRGCH